MTDAPPVDPEDCFALLVREHAEIEVRLKALDRAAHALHSNEGDVAALRTILDVLSFFGTDGARHEEHEERTLFPHLRPVPEFKQLLSAFEYQHRMNHAEGQALAACVEGFAPGGGRALGRQAVRFAEAQRGHMFAEERALFPAAAAKLAPAVIAAMTREIRARQAAPRPATRRA